MKLPSWATKVLTNKYVLYFVLFLAVSNVFGYMVMGQFTAVMFFVLLAYLVSNFSKNMIIVLGMALVFSSVLLVGGTTREGMETAVKNKEKKSKGDKDDVVVPVADMIPTDESDVTLNSSSVSNAEDMNVMSKKKNRIDYATTIQDAYGDLNNILGSEGIKKLTEDTQRLMDQQLKLAEAMNGMAPLMENAKSMLQGFDLDNLNGLADIAKSFPGSSSK
jgi:hypothetical protein